MHFCCYCFLFLRLGDSWNRTQCKVVSMGTTHSWPALFWCHKSRVKNNNNSNSSNDHQSYCRSAQQFTTVQNRVWASKTCQMLLVSYSSLHRTKGVLPCTPTFFRAIRVTWNCHSSIYLSIRPAIHPSIHSFKSSVSAKFVCSFMTSASFGCVTAPRWIEAARPCLHLRVH